MFFPAVGFGGSRFLPLARRGGLLWRVFVSLVPSPAFAFGFPGVRRRSPVVFVGCCLGADAAVLCLAVFVGFRVRLFAAFGRCAGSGPFSAARLVRSFPARCGVGSSVSWWAGGRGSLASRLRGRSLALVAALPAGSLFVGFLGPRRSVGTVLSCRAAAARGLVVVVFPVGGVSAAVLPSLGAGCWRPVGGSAVWSRGFVWCPGVSSL